MPWPLSTLYFPREYHSGLLDSENEGNVILPNIRNYSPSDNGVISRRFESSILNSFPTYFPKCSIYMLAIFNYKIDQMTGSSVHLVSGFSCICVKNV
jgi:hypothetical protein